MIINMTDYEKALTRALQMLGQEKRYAKEQIAARLAYYLQPMFADWNVDPEYNRDGHKIKRADGVLVVPDVIIHRRGTPDNLLVIEVKKSNTRKADREDMTKLRVFRESHLGYRYGLFLKLIVGRERPVFSVPR